MDLVIIMLPKKLPNLHAHADGVCLVVFPLRVRRLKAVLSVITLDSASVSV